MPIREAGLQHIAVLEHPNKEKYRDQRLYLIELSHYIYVVPFVTNEADEGIALKTIYPSRYFTKRYLGRKNADEER